MMPACVTARRTSGRSSTTAPMWSSSRSSAAGATSACRCARSTASTPIPAGTLRRCRTTGGTNRTGPTIRTGETRPLSPVLRVHHRGHARNEMVETVPMSAPEILPEAEPMSVDGTTTVGVLVIHGFTGNPSSMRGIAEAMAALGHHVEMPRLPGHGTTIDDMLTTSWADWSGEVRTAHARLAARVDEIVVVGLSMGGALTLWSGFELDQVGGSSASIQRPSPSPS